MTVNQLVEQRAIRRLTRGAHQKPGARQSGAGRLVRSLALLAGLALLGTFARELLALALAAALVISLGA